MPNVLTALKQEIARIAKKQARAVVSPVRTLTLTSRRGVADLKRRLKVLEGQNRLLQAQVTRLAASQPEPVPEKADKARITAKGMKSLQRRLRLSTADFAKLLGVTSQAVYVWHQRNGGLRLMPATRAALLAARSMGAREAKAKLAAMPKARKPVAKGKKRARRR